MIRRIASLAAILAATGALAADKTTPGVIDDIQLHGYGTIYVRLAGQPNLCNSAANKTFATITKNDISGRDADVVKNQLSALLAAKLAGKSVTLVAGDGVDYCVLKVVDLTP